MPVFPRTSRVVSFRLSAEEYDVLTQVSEKEGAHSVSDYARWTVRHALGGNGGPVYAPLPDQVRSLHVRMDELSREVTRLKSLFGGGSQSPAPERIHSDFTCG
jgi:hypothetical protein